MDSADIAPKNNARPEGIRRLNTLDVGPGHPHFLHFRSLFADLQAASAHAKGRLLDMGCGNKPYEEMFAGRISEYVGCDVVQSSDQRVDVICQATAIPLEDATFNTILCTQVIEHVADHRSLLREAFRLLQGGGILILSAPMYWPLHEEPYDFFRFTEHGLSYLLEDTGFIVNEIECNGGQWATCGQVLVHAIQSSRFSRPILVKMINRVFAYLDDRRKIRSNPMNYVIVAHKSP